LKDYAWNRLGSYLKETQILGSIQNTLYWDQNTLMPKKGSSWRAEQLTYLAKNLHKRNSSQEFAELIKLAAMELNDSEDQDEDEKINKNLNIKLLNQELDRQKKLDPKLIEKLARAKSKGYESWQQAKNDSDYKIFLPFFKELIDLRIEEANQLSEKYTPWETLAQPYEPDITKDLLEKIFKPLKQSIPLLLENIKESTKIEWDINQNSQKFLCSKLLDEFGREKELVAVAESPHPFSITLGPKDFRITTRIVKGEPFSSLLATAHEWGHSIYEQGLPAQTHQWFSWPLGQATSMAVHESQSLFWENRIVKSKSFAKSFFGNFVDKGCPLKNYLDFWKSINKFETGLNRVEADELTYGLHILIRTELEIELIEGNLDPKDLPNEWNKQYQDLLGIKPSNDSEGCLQDVHWSEGAFGYFPSYLIGHLISAQISHSLESDIGLIDDLISNKEYKKIIQWLKENVHCYGRSLNAMELVKKISGENLSPDYFINYLKDKINSLNNNYLE
tara:strand:+ start:15149 stop:16663 length:1515 start_codon:yes stop_codon:yes gene_type:complete